MVCLRLRGGGSIADFYIENGLDEAGGYGIDDWLRGQHQQEEETIRAAKQKVRDDRFGADASLHWPLNESDLDYQAETRGWETIDTSSTEAPMASYRRDSVRLNFYLSTGTVASFLDHPKQRKSQLFRGSCTMADATKLFDDPRSHTGKGYHTREEKRRRGEPAVDDVPEQKRLREESATSRVCAACGYGHYVEQFSKRQRAKGASARCKTCVQEGPTR